MTKINQIVAKVSKRKAEEEAALIAAAAAEKAAQEALEAAIESEVEEMLGNADQMAFYAMKLRAMLALIEAPLQTTLILLGGNADMSLELAQKMNSEFDRLSGEFAPILDSVDDVVGDEADGDDADVPCDCCSAERAAEAVYTDGPERAVHVMVVNGGANAAMDALRAAAANPMTSGGVVRGGIGGDKR